MTAPVLTDCGRGSFFNNNWSQGKAPALATLASHYQTADRSGDESVSKVSVMPQCLFHVNQPAFVTAILASENARGRITFASCQFISDSI